MEVANSMKIEKFDGRNFKQWKFQLKCALRAKGLNIDKERPNESSSQVQWDKDDGMAMFILTSSMDLNQISLIENCETAKEVMKKLEAIYEQKSEYNKMIIHEKFYQYSYCASDTMAQHVSKVEGLAKQLREIGEKISDTAVITKILSTLPPTYRSLRQAWLSLDEDSQSIQNLTSRLVDEEASLANDTTCNETALVTTKESRIENNQNSSNDQRNLGHRFVCYNCNKRGHFARDCKMPKKKLNKNQKPHNMLAFSAEGYSLSEHGDKVWILDSGASMHMTFRRDYFCTLKESQSCDINQMVKLGNKQSIKVCGEGTILINKQVKGKWEQCKLENVLYVPELRRNLFSEGAATRKGYVIVKNNEKAMIMKNNIVVMCAQLTENNLYELDIKTIIQENCNIVQTDIKVWHERLGHLNVKELQNMSKSGVIPVTLSGKGNFSCEACQYGKHARSPFLKSTRGPSQPGEIVYSDVCGPIEQPSVSGMKYFVLFKDGATSYRHVYFMKHKSEVFNCFIKYNANVKNKYHHDVQILHTDNGCEYVNQEFKSFLEKNGITHERTAPYTPQQNGRAERELRTIMESARTMLYAKAIPLNLWAEAVNCAVYLLNRNTSSQTGNVTPFELWHGVKPSLQHIRIFGSIGYVHVPKEKRKKLDKKSIKMLLVGYDHDNYRMYDQNNRKITLSRDVKFEEYFTPEEKQNYTEMRFDVEEKEQSILPSPQSKSQAQHNATQETSSNEDSMESYEDTDDTYHPPKGFHLEQEEQRNITLRPRRNNKVEVNLTELEIPNTYEEAINSANCHQWKKAVAEELQSHENNKTWIITERNEKKPVTCKWVFSIKKNKDGEIERYKARLCARGFTQVKGLDYNETFSPTSRYDSIRLILSIAAREGLQIEQFDVKTAFLYGELSEEIYMEMPEGVEAQPSKVCKLIKSIYGLKQSSRCWNKKFCSFLTTYGFKPCASDNCVFVGYFNNIKVILILYVDDGLLLAKNKIVLFTILNDLKQNFDIKILKFNSFIGMEINKTEDCISINQKQYVETIIDKFNLLDAKSISTPADVNVHLSKNTSNVPINFPYREAVGALLFLTCVSRPDIAYAVNVVSRYVNDPGPLHVTAVKRILRYLINTKEMSIVYKGNKELVGYSDSDFAGDLDTRKSNTGYIFLMNGGPVTWSSRKQNTVALSTTESEYMAASEATKEILWIRQFMCDIGELQNTFTLHVDNQSAIKLINNPVFHKRSKHIDIRYNFIRENVAKKIVNIKYVESSCQLADFLTKALPVSQFNCIRDKILENT